MDFVRHLCNLQINCIVFILFSMISTSYAEEQFVWNKFNYSLDRYRQEDALKIADIIVALQRPTGGWGKNIQPDKNYSKEELLKLTVAEKINSAIHDKYQNEGQYSHKTSTLDNGATHQHIRYLLRIDGATGNQKYYDATVKGLNYLLQAQTDSGGWPQNYPNQSSYGGHVTFNDHAMYGAMTALSEAAEENYITLPPEMQMPVKKAIERGVDYIINAQIIVEGKKTAWCQQHNRETYAPERGRIYELPSISALESVNLVKILMQFDNPDGVIKDSIVSAIQWFEASKIEGIKIIKVYDKKYETSKTIYIKEDPHSKKHKAYRFKGRGYDKIVAKSEGRPIWARFYDIDTQLPIFAGWDGEKKIFSRTDRL